MPDAWTHILASNEIIKGIESSRYRSILEGYIKFYQCGSQGPDIFLYYCNLIPSKHNRVKRNWDSVSILIKQEILLYIL